MIAAGLGGHSNEEAAARAVAIAQLIGQQCDDIDEFGSLIATASYADGTTANAPFLGPLPVPGHNQAGSLMVSIGITAVWALATPTLSVFANYADKSSSTPVAFTGKPPLPLKTASGSQLSGIVIAPVKAQTPAKATASDLAAAQRAQEGAMQPGPSGKVGRNVVITIDGSSRSTPEQTTGAALYDLAGNPASLTTDSGVLIPKGDEAVNVTAGRKFVTGKAASSAPPA
jgi:hypothetical protein